MFRLSLFVLFSLLLVCVCSGVTLRHMAGHSQLPVKQPAATPAYVNKMFTATEKVAPLGNSQLYIHGAGFGAAGAFLANSLWSSIFREVQPGLYSTVAQLDKTMTGSTNSQILTKAMLLLENCPVIAAYSVVHTLALSNEVSQVYNPANAKRVLGLEWDVFIDPTNPTDLSKLKIAHGTPLTLVLQNLAKSIPVSTWMEDVKTAPSGLEWLEMFGRSIALFRQATQAKINNVAGIKQEVDAKKAIDIATSFMGKNGGLVLDIKSTYSTGQQISQFVATLRTQYGINVIGVGSFVFSQFDGLDKSIRAVRFFHTVIGFLNEYRSGAIQAGQTVMFNAGSLLNEDFSLNKDLVSQLQAAKNAVKFDLAFYVQEPAISPKAVTAIVNFTKRNAALVNLGFAWGNIDGRSESRSVGTGLGAQASMLLIDKAMSVKTTVVQGTKLLWQRISGSKQGALAPK